MTREVPEPPAYDPAEIYGIVPKDPRKQYDVRELIARLVDGSRFHEFKARYAPTIVTGFAHLHSYPVGIVATASGDLYVASRSLGVFRIRKNSGRFAMDQFIFARTKNRV